MPYQPIQIDGLDDDELAQVNAMLEQLQLVTRRNLLRDSYYDGKRAIHKVGTVIPAQYYRLGIVLGWSAKAVDILARRCNLDEIVWPDGNLDDLGHRELWDDNDLGAEIAGATVSSLIHGPAFLINTVGDVDADEPKSLIHVKDALNATGLWNARRRQLDALLSITSRDAKGKPDGMVVYFDGYTSVLELGDGRWSEVDRSTHDYGVPAEPLVYKRRPGRPFGSSRISRAVMSLHDQALRTVIRMEGHADVYSIPEMWLLGADESIFKNADGSQKASWQIVLGRIKGVPDDHDSDNPRADVKQFAASSPEPHIAQLRTQARLFAGETSIPEASLGVAELVNPTSADAYIASREDLIAEAEGATDDWTPAIRRTIIRALQILNGESKVPDEWSTIEPKWRSPMHLSRAAQADAGSKQLAAAPWLAETEVGLELLGLDPQQARRAIAEKRRNAGRQVLAALTAEPATTTPASPAQETTP